MTELTEQVGKLREAGMSRSDIAAKLGISLKSVKRRLEEYRVAQRASKSPEAVVAADIMREANEEAVRVWKSRYRTLAKRAGLEERLIETARECIVGLPLNPPKKLILPSHVTDREDALVAFADLHTGEVIDRAETLGINEYNSLIMARRIEFVVEKFLSIVRMHRQNARITKAWIPLLGDMVSGTLHELQKYADADMFGQVLTAAKVITQAIYEIAAEFDEVEVIGVPGNHGRMTEKPENKKYHVNYDFLVYQIVAFYLQNQRNVVFRIPKARVAVANINNFNWAMTHGDLGPSNPKSKASAMRELLSYTEERIDGVIMAHLHYLDIEETLGGPVVVVGSLAGAGGYNVGKLGLASRPTQLVAGIHERQNMAWRYPIALDGVPHPNAPLRYNIDEPNPWAAGVLH